LLAPFLLEKLFPHLLQWAGHDQSYQNFNLAGFTIPAFGFFIIGNAASRRRSHIPITIRSRTAPDAVALFRYVGSGTGSFPQQPFFLFFARDSCETEIC